jgi:bacterioferritin-associated ferredoxin
MFVCLCRGVTAREVARAVKCGACTSKQVASMCGAGSDCGRCRPTVRSIIASAVAHAVASDMAPTSISSRRAVSSNRLDVTVRAM